MLRFTEEEFKQFTTSRNRGLTLNGTVSHVKGFLSDKSKHCGQ